MSRKISLECPRPPQVEFPATTYHIQLITPLFGGGVEAGVNDPITRIRPSSIRGHLRFWWRATRGAKYTTVSELHQQERAIWGTTDEPSRIAIEVEVQREGPEEAPFEYPPGRNFPAPVPGYPAYALFPFQGNPQKNEPVRKARKGIQFIMKLTSTGVARDDIEAALWAWTNFGGIGARTRRGCGALYCRDFAPTTTDSLREWITSAVGLWTPPSGPVPWPILGAAPVLSTTLETPTQAWQRVIDILRKFRQGPGVGRNPGVQPNRPGRSRWPEADSLRMITREGKPAHFPSITVKEPAFPRAALGLPIVFHFKDHEDSPNNTELLLANGGTRMASPFILRPLGVGDGSRALAMLLLLNTTPPGDLKLKGIGHSAPIRMRSGPYPTSPMRGYDTALEAFVAFATAELSRS